MRKEVFEDAVDQSEFAGPSYRDLVEVDGSLPEILSAAENNDLYKMYLRDVEPFTEKFNTFEEDVVLWEKVKAGGQEAIDARNSLFFSVARLSIAGAARLAKGDDQLFMDLVSVGNLAVLERAVSKYNPFHNGQEIKFVTYAWWWIRQSQIRAVSKENHPLKLPVQTTSDVNRTRRFLDIFQRYHGRKPSYEELATVMDVSPKAAEKLLTISEHSFVSLEQGGQNDDEDEWGPMDVTDENAVSRDAVEDRIDEKDELQKIVKVINTLPPKAQMILKMRMGIDAENRVGLTAMTLNEVGDTMGRTRERVRQMQTAAIGKIKDPQVRGYVLKLLVPRSGVVHFP
ncbi:MAG TPA: sigma-70 family RNA polymerase sigma factor [Patescibacteria group bacterium]|nr:sigma-70 family RNA polymerase sigma factor [Patescibacteria group bacterium]